ncbi:RNA polymerase sigma factor [Pedobacter faecalis]|uniref:RNA polymerase sigma factor n=1 Tax=Pedobacter faecalis TaxID=3041495 RepID=UPI00254A6741|nr:RNA polymerase sigma-70 factor [Pedobacter sp. ELA7]
MRGNSNSDEKQLVLQLKAGSAQAFETLYHAYKLRIAGQLYKLLKSEELVEEMMQEFFLKIWDNRAKIDPDQSFRSYLFRVSENMVYDFFRKASRDSKFREQLKANYREFYTHVEEGMLLKEDNTRLSQAIALLPPQRREIFILCKIEGKSYKEVSEILGISTSTVNNQLLLANKFLKQTLNADTTVILIAAMLLLQGT